MRLLDFLRPKVTRKKSHGANQTDNTHANCPYCDIQLSKIPSRKTKCKSCGNYIYPRKHFHTKQQVFLMDSQLKAYDAEKTQYYFEKEWIRKLHELDITDQEIQEERELLAEKWGSGHPKFNDLVWSLFNKQVLKCGKRGTSFHELKMLYFIWALFATEINSDPQKLLQQSHKYELLGYQQNGVKKVTVHANQGCDMCQKLEGKTFKVNELLPEQNILPNENCNHKLDKKHKYAWCRCMFLAESMLTI